MTFYQELQLSQAGSKSYIASLQNPKDKLKHTGIYLFKYSFLYSIHCFILHIIRH